MTLDDIEAMTATTISPAQAASVIGCNEQALRIQARERPEWLGFPVIRINNQIKIPREAFLRYMGRGERGTERC